MALVHSYSTGLSHDYTLLEDQDSRDKKDSKGSKTSDKVSGSANSSVQAQTEDDDSMECCACWGRTFTGSKGMAVDPKAIKGCSLSMEGSTMSRRSSIRLAGPEYFSFPAVKGMRNLGNTCYLNSVLQCLNQTVEFHKLLSDAAHPSKHDQEYLISYLHGPYDSKLHVKVAAPKLGRCGKELYYFTHQLNSQESTSVVKPNKVLSVIRQKEERFRGNSPQDSHEVFRFILDCIRSEEFEEIKKSIYAYFEVKRKSLDKYDREKQEEVKGYTSRAERQCKLLKKVFLGSVANFIICRECHTVLKLCEEFVDLSIPTAKAINSITDSYFNSYENAKSSSFYTATDDTAAHYVDAPVDIISSPVSTTPRSDRGTPSAAGISQCELELSMHQTPKSSRRSSVLYMLPNRTSVRYDESFEAVQSNASFSDSVRTGIIVIPRVPTPSTVAASATPLTQSENYVDATSTTTAVVEHDPTPVSTISQNDDGCSFSPKADVPVHGSIRGHSANDCCNDDFTTNEKELQLYLKKNGFPYRAMRRNVETDLEAGLQAYFELDVLDENNKFMCDNCTAKRMEERGYPEDATTSIGLSKVSKQFSITDLPEILVLQIKRFSIGVTVSKYTEAITFPLILDMAPYCSNDCLVELADCKMRVLYGLYGIIEHLGSGLLGGHYVTYIRRREKKIRDSFVTPSQLSYDEKEAERGDWFFTSDRQVKKVPGGFDEVKQCQAYMLFYERLSVH